MKESDHFHSFMFIYNIIIDNFLNQVQAKQTYRKIEQELHDTEEKLEENRQLLKTIISEEYISTMAKKCDSALTSRGSNSSGGSWFQSASASSRNHADTESILTTIIRETNRALIGDAALSADEKDAKELEELQHTGDNEAAAIEKLSVVSDNSESQEQSEQKLEWVVDENGNKVAKKSIFVI